MPLKRKAASPSFSPPAETQFREDDAPLYAAECILDEDGGRASKGKYLIKWAGLDPETGEPWLPSWEPRDGVSNDLIAEWKAKKTLDSSIVGEEGAKFREMLRVKMEKERKKKRAQGGPARKRERKSRETSKQIGKLTRIFLSIEVEAVGLIAREPSQVEHKRRCSCFRAPRDIFTWSAEDPRETGIEVRIKTYLHTIIPHG